MGGTDVLISPQYWSEITELVALMEFSTRTNNVCRAVHNATSSDLLHSVTELSSMQTASSYVKMCIASLELSRMKVCRCRVLNVDGLLRNNNAAIYKPSLYYVMVHFLKLKYIF